MPRFSVCSIVHFSPCHSLAIFFYQRGLKQIFVFIAIHFILVTTKAFLTDENFGITCHVRPLSSVFDLQKKKPLKAI